MATQRTTRAQRDAIRAEIATLQAKFPPKQVPCRVLTGSHQDAVAWKKAMSNPPHHIRNPPGNSLSGQELTEIRDNLAAFIKSVN